MTPTDMAYFAHEEPPTLIRRRPAAAERRGAARLPLEIDVHVEGAAHCFDATTADVSSGGMFVITSRAIPEGTNVRLAFTLPNGTALEVVASVEWRRAEGLPGLGLSFFCLAPDVKETLAAFCDAREPLYYGDDPLDEGESPPSRASVRAS